MIRRQSASRGDLGTLSQDNSPRISSCLKQKRGPQAPGTQNAPCWSATSCSPTDYSAVPSALGGLTSGFGMGPGVPPLPWSLTNKGHSASRGGRSRALGAAQRDVETPRRSRSSESVKRRARPISTARLNASQRLHLRPIELVVYEWPYRRENSSRDWLPA